MKFESTFWLLGVGILFAAMAFNVQRLPDARGAGLFTGGIPLRVAQSGYGSAFVPFDWIFWTDPAVSAAIAYSADRTMFAGWVLVPVNQDLRPAYGDLFADPATSMQFLTNQILWTFMGDSSRMRYISYLRPFMNYFTLSYFQSDQTQGLLFYKIYPGSSERSYTESVYWAIAQKSKGQIGLNTAAGVAVSIRSFLQYPYSAPGLSVPMNAGPVRPGCGAAQALRGYQKELGVQFAHSPYTGQNFLMDPLTQWNEVGPQGPGYYRTLGNGYEKLEPGWSDGC